ncbi:MAG: efflux RND transporter periplasmic adaptor subunit [Bauldia sp.]
MTAARQIVLSLLVIALAGGGWWLYRSGSFAGAATVAATPDSSAGQGRRSGGGMGAGPVRVVTAPVDINDDGDTVRAIGTLVAAQSVTLFPEVTGAVSEIAFKPGTRVDAGAAIIRLEKADQQVEVERATIARDDAQAALDRAEKLLASKNITAVAVSDARSVLQKAGIDLKIADLALAKRTVSAPFAGVIGLTELSIGDLVTPTRAIANLDDMSTVTVAFDVPENVSAKVAIGQEVTATSTALPDQTFTGKVSAIDNRIDATSRTLKVEAEMPNDANVLKAGMSVIVVLNFPGEARPMVPSLAVQWDRKGSFVWKLDGDEVHRVPVRIIARNSGSVTVAGELQKGQQVVVEGVQRLREGIKVAEAGQGAQPPAEGAATGAGKRPAGNS